MKLYLLQTALLLSLLMLGRQTQAQAPGGTGPTPQADPTTVPLDGGASLLMAGGVAFGVRCLRRRKPRP